MEPGKFKIKPFYFTATVMVYSLYFCSTFWYFKIRWPALLYVARKSDSVLGPVGVALLLFSAMSALSLELLVLLAKCQDLLAIINEYGTIQAPELVVKGFAKKVRRTAAFFAGVPTMLTLPYIIASVIQIQQYSLLLLLPCTSMYCVCDIIFAVYNVVPQVYIKYLNTEISNCLKNQQLGRIGSLQARHATAVSWIERLADCFGHVAAIRVVAAFSLNLAAFVMVINGNPLLTFGNNSMFITGMALSVLHGFCRMHIFCHYAAANSAQVKVTSRLLAKIDTSCCNIEERLQLLGFYCQLSNTVPEITSNGFFSIGKGLLLSFLGHVGTYVVVFLQFNPQQQATPANQ